jgi:hypothetical protein
LVMSWAYEPPLSTERFSVVGELWSLSSDGRSLTVTLRASGGQTYDFSDVDTYAYEMDNSLSARVLGHVRCTPRRRASTCSA